jgi:thiamine-monophosphate kinase
MTPTEARRIAKLIRDLGRNAALPLSGLTASVGVSQLDDCAVIPIPGGDDLVVGSDFVRGEHFKLALLGLLSRAQVGYYLIGANVSDLAAMGAKPVGVTVTYRYTNDTTDEQHSEVMHGIVEACRDMGAPLLGGDSGEYHTSVLTATAIGVCPHGRALLRSRARAGDALFITGDVGVAGAALRYFSTMKPGSLPPETESALLAPWRRVTPATKQAAALVEERLSVCAIDTSDGLKTACRQLAASSRIDVIVREDQLPINPIVRQVAVLLGCDPVSLTCGDSVDFRLLFSAPSNRRDALVKLFLKHNWPLFEIGRFVDCHGAEPAARLDDGNELVEMPGIEKS